MQRLLQGLKPDVNLIGFIGPTKVRPLLQSPRNEKTDSVFQQPVKPSRILATFGTTKVRPFLLAQ
jgi:hypothetical protein